VAGATYLGRIAATLTCLVAMSAQTAVVHASDPIPGVDVVVEKVPPGHIVARATTDDGGCLRFKDLELGRYVVSDAFGNRAVIYHEGGSAKWRLFGSIKDRKPTWSVVDKCAQR